MTEPEWFWDVPPVRDEQPEPECDCEVRGDVADAIGCLAHGPSAPRRYMHLVAMDARVECPF